MWTLLLNFWKPLAGAALVIGVGWFLHHRGYESGYAASEAKWQPRFAQAERDRAREDEKNRRKESDSIAITQLNEAEHAAKVSSLELRAADAERRYASILRKHSAGSSCVAVPTDGSAAGDPDAVRASSELIDRTSKDFAALARRCESDSAALTSLQEWVRAQHALFAD